jgi:2-keto-4-pentenoate hydratase/2-oxohepta-3-ene-1,7-dioic acid hydratase in catechol pathway
MRLAHFHHGTTSRLGVVVDDQVNDLAASAPDLPTDPLAFLTAGPDALSADRRATDTSPAWLPLADVRLLAPVPRPGKFVAMALNYRDHLEETGMEAPTFPTFFTKQSTCVVGPGDDVEVPRVSDLVDYEGELAVVIGRGGRRIGRSDALDHVFGYTIVNDVTARELQRRHVQWYLGKSPDSFCPMGPAIVSADELPDIGASWLRTHVNGELRQEARIADLLFDVPTLIATISETTSLEPGDVIATGTPVGTGMAFDPPRFLTAGDRVEVTIDGIGTLGNPVR